jgi:outer membrane biosynthesis protein TonB
MKALLLFAGLAATIFTVSVSAQTTQPELVKLPKAVNPADGYPDGGSVQVRVTVNEQGEVTDAKFVRGPGPVCGWVTRPDVTKTREAALALAREAKFSPATSGGVPVASSTIMSVEFAASPSKRREKVVGERNYTAAKPEEKLTIRDKAISNDPPKANKSNTIPPDATKYTVKGDVVSNPPNTESSKTDPPNMSVPSDPGTAPFRALTDPDGGQPISGGFLNGKAMKLPKPIYPAAARAVRASGAVQVQVLIDYDGNVFLAQALGGHPLLQPASVAAACSSQFTRTLLEGQPVMVSGIIVYNFVP